MGVLNELKIIVLLTDWETIANPIVASKVAAKKKKIKILQIFENVDDDYVLAITFLTFIRFYNASTRWFIPFFFLGTALSWRLDIARNKFIGFFNTSFTHGRDENVGDGDVYVTRSVIEYQMVPVGVAVCRAGSGRDDTKRRERERL